MTENPIAFTWGLLATHTDLATNPTLVKAALDSGDAVAAASLLHTGQLNDRDALAAAKVLAPKPSTEIPWDARRLLHEKPLPATVQRHFARNLGKDLAYIAEGFTDADAIATIVRRALPAKAPTRVTSPSGRAASAAAAPLEALRGLVEDPDLTDHLVQADLFPDALRRITQDYPADSEYATTLGNAVLSVAARAPQDFQGAAAGFELPAWMLHSLSNSRWIGPDLAAHIYETGRDLAAHSAATGTTDHRGWRMLQQVEPQLDDARREDLRSFLGQHQPPQDSLAFRKWAASFLGTVDGHDIWDRELDTAELHAQLASCDYRVPQDHVAAVLARADLTAEAALAVADHATDSHAAIEARLDRDFAVHLLARNRTLLTRFVRAEESPVAQKWPRQERLDIAGEALARNAMDQVAAKGPAVSFEVPAVMHDLAGDLGDAVLALPCWAALGWAESNHRVGATVAHALLPAMSATVSRDTLTHLLEANVEGRTSLSLREVAEAAEAAGL